MKVVNLKILEKRLLFESYDDIQKYLAREYISVRQERGEPIPTLKDVKGLLKFASGDILHGFLDKATTELLPKKKYEVAREIAEDIAKIAAEKEYKTVEKANILLSHPKVQESTRKKEY